MMTKLFFMNSQQLARVPDASISYLLHIELAFSFLIGRKRAVRF